MAPLLAWPKGMVDWYLWCQFGCRSFQNDASKHWAAWRSPSRDFCQGLRHQPFPFRRYPQGNGCYLTHRVVDGHHGVSCETCLWGALLFGNPPAVQPWITWYPVTMCCCRSLGGGGGKAVHWQRRLKHSVPSLLLRFLNKSLKAGVQDPANQKSRLMQSYCSSQLQSSLCFSTPTHMCEITF